MDLLALMKYVWGMKSIQVLQATTFAKVNVFHILF